MATLDPTRTSAFRAAARALDHAIDAAIDGRPGAPAGTTFVPADLVRSGRLTSYRRLGPVSVVDADGNEIRLPRDHTRELALAVVLVGLVVWAVSRRP